MEEIEIGKTYVANLNVNAGSLPTWGWRVAMQPCTKGTEIPKKHIVKRWTRDARDILPTNLIQVLAEGPCSTKPI